MIKRTVFVILIVFVLVGLISLIPDSPSKAYPVPPTGVGPIWFGVYCKYPGAPTNGYLRVKWDEGFPSGYIINPENPGQVTVFYPPNYYQHLTLSIVTDDVSHIWGALWTPIKNETAQIYGYVILRLPNGADYGYFAIDPTYVYKSCPDIFQYLPLLRR